MNKVVSEDALRRALERIDEAASAAWLRPSLSRLASLLALRRLNDITPTQSAGHSKSS